MKTENIQCDFCGKITTEFGNKKERINGLVIEIGYSIGGWGSRRDFIKTSGEVCDSCFECMKSAIEHLIETKRDLNNLKSLKK